MKAVRDAVIWLKGEIPTRDTDGDNVYLSDVIIYCHAKGEQAIKGEFNFGTGDYKKDVYCYVCSQPEFNTYVDSLSHHVGKELFQQYLAADKPLLEKSVVTYFTPPMNCTITNCTINSKPADKTKETKVDYTSEEFWKDAPEGATHYEPETITDNACWVMVSVLSGRKYVTVNEYKLNPLSFIWIIDREVESKSIPRPQPKPVFTQEMSDKWSPEVGRHAMCGDNECMVIGEHCGEFWCKFENGCLQTWSADDLTQPVEPEEKAVNDMVEQLTNEGIVTYDPIMLRILIEKFKGDKISGVTFQPLTVEVK